MIRISIGRSFVRDNISQGGGADERTKKGVMRIDPFPVPLSLLFPLSPRYISILWGCNLILGGTWAEGMGGAKERSHDIGGGRDRLRTEVEEGSWREKSGKTTLASVAALCSLLWWRRRRPLLSSLCRQRCCLLTWLSAGGWKEALSLSPRLLLFSPFSLSGGDGRESGNGGSRGGRKDRRTDGELKRKRKKKELHLPYRSAAFALFYYCPRRLREKIDT